MIWRETEPTRGDIVRTKVSFYHHYGIFVDPQRVIQFGLPTDPMRSGADIRVIATDVYTFLNGGQLEVGVAEGEEKLALRSAEQCVREAEAHLGEGGYDLIHNNCEHFVNRCAFGKSESGFISQVRQKLRQKLGKKD